MEFTIDQVLQKGIEAHKAGKIQEADKFYTAILQVQPQHPDANHNMGVLAFSIGNAQEALTYFKKAVDSTPSILQFWLSYIDALIKLNKITDAIRAIREANIKGIKGKAFDQLRTRINKIGGTVEGADLEGESDDAESETQDPAPEQLQPLIDLYVQGQFDQVLAFHSAQKQHGGVGSTYLLLKKDSSARKKTGEKIHQAKRTKR